MNPTHKVPWIRIAKRDSLAFWHGWLIRLAGLVLALFVSAIVIYSIVHLNPFKVYEAMFEGNFGTSRRMWVSFRDMAMLLCIGIGLAPAFKMRFWNIGAEGQILIGGIATAAVMLYLGKSMPTWALLAVSLVASLIAGAVWGAVPALFKARYGTNETLFTLMMNYVAIQLTSYFVAIWENPFGSNTVGIINQRT
ncbi:MAG TPA: ABC transporter permease, partial [Candidatus Limiplasma sp.]|nr:ABC transporter permease [Candidatus Limiplasma sp.]